MKPWILCPALNEEASVGDVVASGVGAGYRVVVIDDGSTDATGDVARAAGAIVVRHPLNLGVGAAIQTGIRVALRGGATVVVQVDADGQHLVGEVQHLVEAIDEQTHLVIGSRFATRPDLRPHGLRGVAMRSLARRASAITGVVITDASSGFRAISRPLLDDFALHFPSSWMGDTFGALLLASRLGYGVKEVPVEMRDRQGGVPSTRGGRAALLVARAVASSITRETKGYR